MNDQQREALSERYWRAEDKFGRFTPARLWMAILRNLKQKLLEQQEEIEFLLGADYFDKRDRLPG